MNSHELEQKVRESSHDARPLIREYLEHAQKHKDLVSEFVDELLQETWPGAVLDGLQLAAIMDANIDPERMRANLADFKDKVSPEAVIFDPTTYKIYVYINGAHAPSPA